MEVAGYCTLCRSRCGSLNEIEDGRLLSVKPLPGHPTGGALCAKGRAAPELVGSPRRLANPMRRTRPRTDPDPGWETITWDEALTEIAAKLVAIRASQGAESVAFAVTTPSGTPMIDSFEWVERFVRCFGSPNLVYAVEVCGWHKDYAHALTFGRGIGAPDYEQADVIVLWGHNPARTWLAQATRVADAKRRGAQVVVIDPKPDGSGQEANLWLRIRPGADAALALGAIHHLILTQGYDAGFVKRWTNAPMLVNLETGRLLTQHDIWQDGRKDVYVVSLADGSLRPYDTRQAMPTTLDPCLRARPRVEAHDGKPYQCATIFELLAEKVSSYTVEHVAELTWIAPENIKHFNKLFSDSPRLAYHSWTGVGQHTNATMTDRAISTLYAMTGACDRAGGNIWTVPPPTNSVNDYSLLAPEQQAKALGLKELPLGPPCRGWITARDFCKAAIDASPYRVAALMSFGTNFVVSQGNSARNLQALQALDFHVHVDMFMNPTAQNADIVLPANMPWEREALKVGFEITQAACELVQFRPRMLPPHGQAKADYDIAFELATRMGMADQFFAGDVHAGWNHQLAPLGVTVEDLSTAPEGRRFPQPFRYEKYAAEHPSGAAPGFATPSRRIEIYSEQLLNLGQPALPCFIESAGTAAENKPHEHYPLVLTTAKSGWFVHSAYRHVASLRRKSPDPGVEIGTGLAREKSIATGDWLNVKTPSGSTLLRARINPALDDRVVIAEYGWWEDCPPLGRAGAPPSGPLNSNINAVLDDREHDPVSGSVPLRAVVCNIERANTQSRGLWSGERNFSIISRRVEASDVAALDLAPCDAKPLPDFLPGQHIVVASADGRLSRSYSLTSASEGAKTLSIGAKRIHDANGLGQMSGYLYGLRPGDILKLTAPAGLFTPPLTGPRPVICIASGIGITPFVGYLESLVLQPSSTHPPQLRLIVVCRNRASHPYADRLRHLVSQLPTIKMEVFYTVPALGDLTPRDYDYLGRPDFRKVAGTLTTGRPLVYLCGPEAFLTSARNAFIAQGVPTFDIFSEMFVSSVKIPNTSTPQPIRISGAGAEFIWKPESGTLLDAAEAAGVRLASGCRVGQCESCMMHIVSGSVAHLSPYDGPSDQCLTCRAIPITPLELKP